MKKVLYVLMLCVCFTTSSQEIDTTLVRLQEKLHNAPSDSIKVETLLNLGKYQFGRDNYSAEDYLLKAIDFIENDAYSSDHQLAIAYRVLGAVERRKGNYKNTFANYYKALRLSSEPQHVATVHHNLGTAKLFQYEFPEAIAEFRKAISIWEDLNNYADAAGSYQEIGGVYRSTKQLDSAKFYYEKALKMFAIGYKDDTLKYINRYYGIQKSLGLVLLHKKKYDSALSKFKEARIHFSKPNHDKSRLIIVNGSISEAYYHKGNYKEAIRYVNEALSISKSEGLKYRIASSLRRRSRLYQRMGNFDAALDDYKLYKKYSDSLINAETIKKIQAQELKYVFEKEKLADSIVFAQEKRKIELVADNEASKKKIYLILLITTLILSTIIAFLVKRDFKHKKRVLELENKNLIQEKEQITNAFTKLKNSTNAEECIKAKQGILKLKILTDDDWLHFRDKFELLYPSFLDLLKDSNFQFTKSETRLLILKKLDLETKEIANMTGVSNDSVLKTQYRLRKKLDIAKTIDIILFLEQSAEN
ncbi:tetratricopeptide repeat protein [uncultured Kordia sp.]|uniref:tetratricopeptide repeat protein n=1 Tax=uncultured Kordia sp. TaxID=507699 RepID=UPI0026061358|nr:tetratricopeptide repeat protein [uncultured Kordia sp.]